MSAPHAKGGKQAGRAKFHERAIAISQDKAEDGSSAAVTAVIVGGGPAGMIAALGLMHRGFRVIVCEEQEALTPSVPAPGEAEGPTEPLLFSPETARQLEQWGMARVTVPDATRPHITRSEPDLGPNARQIPYRDVRALSGRLLRREPSDCYAIRAQDLCHAIHERLTAISADYRRLRKGGAADPLYKATYELKLGVRALDIVDISWGVAAYLSDGQSVAGDMLLGCDGVSSTVRDWMSKKIPHARDTVAVSGFTQWQGGLEDSHGVYSWFGDATHMLLGSRCSCLVYRLPSNVINWAILRPTAMEDANQLSEWKTMMSSWPVDADGGVTIPAEETMSLRAAFDLFDADKSGALDYDEVRTAMEQCGLSLSNKEIAAMAAEIDTDGSGVFEFVEFVELVKLLLVRLREAEEAGDTIEEMDEVLAELAEEITHKKDEIKRLTHKVFEMRKGGAQGKLETEERLQSLPDQIAAIQEQMAEARAVRQRAERVRAKQDRDDHLEYEVAKTALGQWLRSVPRASCVSASSL
ncbi:MAG: EF-hand domain-containing protein [Promethearchaeia archaeon]